MMWKAVVFAALLGVLAPVAARAAGADVDTRPLDLFDVGAPAFANFSPRDGVPNSVTVAVQTDREGFVWLASPLGVARYDGRRWEPSDDPAMAHSVFSLWLDHEGTLWAAFREQGLAHYDGRRWHVENHATGLPSQQIRRFAETRNADGSTQLWALTWDQGLLLRRDGRWIADPGNDQLPRGAIITLAQTQSLGGQPRQWVGTGNEGLWFREDGGRWQRFRTGPFDPAQIEFLLRSEKAGREELWIASFGIGLWRMNEDGLRLWSKESGDLPTNDLYDIVETPLPNGDRALWVSSRSGLVRLHDERVQVFDRRHGLPSDVVRGLSAWRSPNGDAVLWLATESGVSRSIVGANTWLTASLMGAHGTGVFAVLVEPDGRGTERLWVGSSDEGIGLYEQRRWRQFSQANGALPDSGVRMLVRAEDEQGEPVLWAGLRMGHLLRVREGPRFETVPTPWEQHPGQAVLDLIARRYDGRYEQWISTRQSGIYRRRDGAWTAFRPAEVSGQWRVNKLLEQREADGRSWLWAATNQGLARYDGENWSLLGRAAGLAEIDLLGGRLLDDAQGRPVLWLGTASAGIQRVDVSDPRNPVLLAPDLPRAPDQTAYGALRDSAGRIYVCTNNGVQQLTPTAAGYASRVFTRQDGMVHDECNTNGQFIDAHDRFWTGTLGGLTVYDPQRAADDRYPKTLKIMARRIDGQAVEGGELHIPPGARDVRVEFALLSWQREGESRFRTQLLGYDAAPSAWTSENFRSFGALPPDRYVLRVEARDYAGNLSTPVQLTIEMEATWWQRSWARAALAVAVLLLAYALVLWRTRALESQRRALEQRVVARTTELNAANARLLELSYLDALTGLANRRRLLETLEQDPADADRSRTTTLVFVDVDHFKDYNDRYGHPAGDEALRGVANALRRCAPAGALVARYGGEEFACLLPGADIPQGVAVAECIRAAVSASDIPVPGSNQANRVTISAGVACAVLVDASAAHQLLRSADLALYRAKREGRNRVCAA